MSSKEIFKFFNLDYWDNKRANLLVAILMLVVATISAIWAIHPAFLFKEELNYNYDIELQGTFLSQQNLIFLESFNKSIEQDNIEKFDVPTVNDKEKYAHFKLADTGDPTRQILVVFTDPNNVVRYSSPQLSESQISQKNLANLRLHSILVNRFVKIRIPDLSNSNIEGNWHLNIYVYNSENELTLVASRPIESLPFSDKNSNLLLSLIALLLGVMTPLITSIINKKDKIKEDKIKEDKIKEDKIKEEPKTKEDKTKEDKTKKANNLINPSSFKKLEGLVVDVNYGLIKSCPLCGKMLKRGQCPSHGKIKGNYELYLEALLYNGFLEYNLIIKQPVLEKYFEISLDECIALAADYLDPGVVKDLFSQQMIGKWFLLKGIYSFNSYNVESMEINDQHSPESALILYDRWQLSKKL